REHEAIAVGPDRVLRVEAHDAVPNGVDQRGERHRCAGVSGFSRLHRVDRKRANGIDAQLIELRVCHGWSNLRRTHGFLLAIMLIFYSISLHGRSCCGSIVACPFTITSATERGLYRSTLCAM